MEYCVVFVYSREVDTKKAEKIKDGSPIDARIIKASLDLLTKRVNDKIKEGWVPQGGISESGQMHYTYNQAMIRHKK